MCNITQSADMENVVSTLQKLHILPEVFHVWDFPTPNTIQLA
jgi:hypothetical protein